MADRFAAQVLLAPGSDPAVEGARALRAFTSYGFGTGTLWAGSFAIEGDAAVFRSVFGVTLVRRPDGGVTVHDGSGHPLGTQLPVAALPPSLQPLLAAVCFTEPPAFGPGSF
jgi:hypothetical protein